MARIIKTQEIDFYNLDERPDVIEWIYNGLDCCVTLEIYHALSKALSPEARTTYEFTREKQYPVFEMMWRGVDIDDAARMEMREKLEWQRLRLIQIWDRLCMEGLGISGLSPTSNKDLKHLFFDRMQLKQRKKRSKTTGLYGYVVDREAIEKLSYNYWAEPFCNIILKLRDLKKQHDFLAVKLDEDRKLRCTFKVTGTVTGRLSSSSSVFDTGTNLQNVDRNLRHFIRAPKGRKFANIDLEQADSRGLGAICWELFLDELGPEEAGKYLDVCESGDLHTTVCRMAWQTLDWGTDPAGYRKIADGIAYRTYSYRDLAKKLGHGTNYVGQPPTMAMHARIPIDVAKEFHKNYLNEFKVIARYHKYVEDIMNGDRILITPFKRIRRFYDRPSQDLMAEMVAFGPQSMTGDFLDRGMCNVQASRLAWIHLQVHDSLLLSYDEDLEDEILPQLIKLMTITLELKAGRKLIMPVEAKVGWNWGDRQVKKDGTIINPNGLIKWKGKDERKSPWKLNRLPFE